MSAQPLRISYVELQGAVDSIDSIEIRYDDVQHSIPRRGASVFHQNFDQPVTVRGETISVSVVHPRKWPIGPKPAPEVIEISVHDVLPKLPIPEFRVVRNGLVVTLGLSSDSVPDITGSSRVALRPTAEELLDDCPRFRILVIGQSGFGKSALINRIFGIGQASADHLKPGCALIEEELISPQNDRFVLHDSNGFQPGENVDRDAVKSFITERKKREHVKDQLHAVWLCFRIPIPGHGERLLEDGAETFLKEDSSVLQNIPTIVLFMKYDMLLTHMLMQKEADPEAAAEQYLKKHCYAPIEEFAGGADLSYVAVSSFATPGLDGLDERRKRLIDLTHKKVTARFKLQIDTPSPVSVVTLMAQRISPQLKIQGSIDVGRQRYWTTLTSGANFVDHTITECLAVIHTDIVCVWNFNDPHQYLYSDKFRGLMANLAGTIDGFIPESRRLSRIDSTSPILTDPLNVLLPPSNLPPEAGLGVVHWARQTYHQLADVHRKFMAYIVDLVHVLEILFSLTADNDGKKLTRGAVSSAFNTYYDSGMRYNVHRWIKGFDYKIPGRDTVLDEIISLVRMSPIDENDISSAFQRIPSESLAKDDGWLTAPSS